jgi:hypothetical protein
MDGDFFNRIGLVAGILGVVAIFAWGQPQPELTPGVSLGLEGGTVLPDGKTVADHDREVRRRLLRHLVLSRSGLGLVGIGFLCQFAATFIA